uniref:Uncharacterized protein n=1 Tax=Arundo donax TaxID=35708 RepID=A0A0A9B994_ARUDO
MATPGARHPDFALALMRVLKLTRSGSMPRSCIVSNSCRTSSNRPERA